MAAGGCWARMFGSDGWSGARLALCVVIGLGGPVAAGTAEPTRSSVTDALSTDALSTTAGQGADARLSDAPSSGSTVAPAAAPAPLSGRDRAQNREEPRGLLLLLLMRNLSARGPFGAFGR